MLQHFTLVSNRISIIEALINSPQLQTIHKTSEMKYRHDILRKEDFLNRPMEIKIIRVKIKSFLLLLERSK